MRGVWVRWCGVAAGGGASFLLAIAGLAVPGDAAADIYQMRDRYGTIHFTNVPTSGRYKLVMRETRGVRRHGRVGPSAWRTDSGAFDPIIAAVAQRYRVEQALVKAVIRAESSFQPNAISPKGARGLMQLMPATARRHGVRNIHEPYENIQGGVQHLRMLLDRYGGNVVKALAAYNAGERWVDLHGGIPPFAETREYVHRVLQFRQHYLHQALASAR
jgi:soluble lytic murein transglycosylase-like protein